MGWTELAWVDTEHFQQNLVWPVVPRVVAREQLGVREQLALPPEGLNRRRLSVGEWCDLLAIRHQRGHGSQLPEHIDRLPSTSWWHRRLGPLHKLRYHSGGLPPANRAGAALADRLDAQTYGKVITVHQLHSL